MKTLLTTLLVVLAFQSNAQMTIQYGGSVGFDMNYRYLRNVEDLWGINESIIDSRNDIEKFCARPSIGFDTKFNFTDKVGLKTGVVYDVKGYMLKGDFVISLSGGGVETVKIVSRSYDHCIGLPTYFTYTAPLGNANLEFNAGILSNFYLQTNTIGKSKYENGDVIKSKSSHSSLSRFIGQGVIGCNYLFNPGSSPSNRQMSIGLDFKYGFTSISGDSPIKEYYYSIGLNFGILFGGSAS